MPTDRIPMSKEGYEKLKAQLDKYKNEDMPRIAQQIADARGEGDLSENAEFDAAVEAQGMLQARINELQNKLSQAYIVDKSTLSTERAAFGLKVRVLDLDFNEEEDYILVGPGEEDPSRTRSRSPARSARRWSASRSASRSRSRSPRRAEPQDRRDQPGVTYRSAAVDGVPSLRVEPSAAMRAGRARRGSSASGASDAGPGAIGRAARSRAADPNGAFEPYSESPRIGMPRAAVWARS